MVGSRSEQMMLELGRELEIELVSLVQTQKTAALPDCEIRTTTDIDSGGVRYGHQPLSSLHY